MKSSGNVSLKSHNDIAEVPLIVGLSDRSSYFLLSNSTLSKLGAIFSQKCHIAVVVVKMVNSMAFGCVGGPLLPTTILFLLDQDKVK